MQDNYRLVPGFGKMVRHWIMNKHSLDDNVTSEQIVLFYNKAQKKKEPKKKTI
jgi:hypothetical protein